MAQAAADQMMARPPRVPGKLEFTSYDVTDLSTLAPYFSTGDDRCGIYVLRFSDGYAYVGQSGDVVTRFSSHHREWSRKRPEAALIAVEFARCHVEELDAAERAVIAVLEDDTDLLNKMLTDWPGGHGEITLEYKSAEPIRIRAARTDRMSLTADPRAKALRRHRSHQAKPGAGLATGFAAGYLAETMPSPVATAGCSWSCTALPSTSKYERLHTLNVGGLETLFAYYDDWLREPRLTVAMNVALPESGRLRRGWSGAHWARAARSDYTSESVWTWEFDLAAMVDDGADPDRLFEAALGQDERLADLAYQLNRRLMARRPSMWVHHHNEFLAADLLARALRWQVGG